MQYFNTKILPLNVLPLSARGARLFIIICYYSCFILFYMLLWSGGERFHCIVQGAVRINTTRFPRTFVLSSRLTYHINIDYNYPSGNQRNIGNKFCEGKQNCNIVSAGESRNASVMQDPFLYLFIKSKGKFQALRSLPH